jgi:hypothetical protein
MFKKYEESSTSSTYQKYIVSRDEEKTQMITRVRIGIHERQKVTTGQLSSCNKGI